MTHQRRWLGVGVGGCVLALLSACEQHPASPAQGPHVGSWRANAGPALAMAVVSGSATAPIEAHFNVPAIPKVGAPFVVDVVVTAGAVAPVMMVEVTGEEGVTVLTPQAPVSFDKLAAGHDVQVAIEARADTPGAHLLHVVAVMSLPSGPQSKKFELPILVVPAS